MAAPMQLEGGQALTSADGMPMGNRLSVLQLVHSDDRGGVEALAEMIGEGLRQRGVRATTFFLYPDAGAGRIAKLTGMLRAMKRIASERPDALIAYQSTASVIAGAIGRLAGIETRIVHQTAMPEGVHPLVRRLDRWAGGWGLYSANVVNSKACAAGFGDYPARYRASLVMIPHGLPPPVPQAMQPAIRARLGLSPDTRLIVTAGRLSQQKAQERIVAALPLLTDVHLAIAGGGPRLAELRALASELDVGERVTFLGAVPRQDVADLVAAADAFVFPSLWETFGLAAVEAAMVGTPLVVSDLPVLREVLLADEGSPAQFVDTADAAALAGAIRHAIGSADIRDASRDFASKLVERHGVEPMIAAYVELLSGREARQ